MNIKEKSVKVKIYVVIIFIMVVVSVYYISIISKQNVDNGDVKGSKIIINKEENISEKFLLSGGELSNPLKTLVVDSLLKKSAFDNNSLYISNTSPIRTNQWFSSLYFTPTSDTLFSYPLAVRFHEKGLSVSYPQVDVTEDVVFGSFTEDLKLNFHEKINAVVNSSDDFSVNVSFESVTTGEDIGFARITKGSPYIFIKINKNISFEINTDGSNISKFDTYWQVIKGENIQYGVFGFDGIIFDKKNDTLQVEAKKNSLLTIGLRAKNLPWDTLNKYADNNILKTKISFVNIGDEYQNSFEIKTTNDGGTLLGMLPHHTNNSPKKNKCMNNEVFFETIRGEQVLCEGNIFSTTNERRNPIEELNVSQLNDKERKKLEIIVKNDIEKFTNFIAKDTYFLGKELLRAAYLYDFAKQLNLESESIKIKKYIQDEIELWAKNTQNIDLQKEEKYFAYDDKIRGIVGYKSSFGSEKFNDHHFHYGYFIHAAAILGKYDKEFISRNEEFINLLTKEYVNIDRNDKRFAFVRAFDFYEGHSWASGNALFADGNDQESSSEAVHAYYAVFLWASLLEKKELKETSLWLYNQEINSANFYWMLSDKMSPKFNKYKHSIMSMVWGGKAEWSTWFSTEPEAKLAIQLIPFTSGSEYLKYSSEQIEKHLSETSFPVKKLFFDQLLMYKALSDKDKALEMFEYLKNEDIDGGNSRSFLYAWIITH